MTDMFSKSTNYSSNIHDLRCGALIIADPIFGCALKGNSRDLLFMLYFCQFFLHSLQIQLCFLISVLILLVLFLMEHLLPIWHLEINIVDNTL